VPHKRIRLWGSAVVAGRTTKVPSLFRMCGSAYGTATDTDVRRTAA
jgi:hypothetical protein